MSDMTMDQVRQQQTELVRQLEGVPGVLGIGIGRGRGPSTLALHVSVRDKASAARVPPRIGDVDVIVDVTGRIRAY